MQPLVGKYLSASFNCLKDRNNVVRKYYASAIGHLLGIAKVSRVNLTSASTFTYYIPGLMADAK